MENKNGQGVFLGVVGVATLIVAIIGATFAFFSAQTQSAEGAISGNTLGGTEGGVLSLLVEKVWNTPTEASSLDLVPTDVTTSNLANVLTAKCEATPGGSDTTKYTGCHVYRITASSDSAISGANLRLTSLTTTNTANPGDWKFATFTATEATQGTLTSPTLLTGTGASGSFQVTSGTFDLHNGAAMAAGTEYVYYLIVYIENKNVDQSNGTTADVTGSYTGQLTLTAAGGSTVKASFAG